MIVISILNKIKLHIYISGILIIKTFFSLRKAESSSSESSSKVETKKCFKRVIPLLIRRKVRDSSNQQCVLPVKRKVKHKSSDQMRNLTVLAL